MNDSRLLIVSQDRPGCCLLAEHLRNVSVNTQQARNLHSALEQLHSTPPQTIVIDESSFGDSGREIRDALNQVAADVPRIVLGAPGDHTHPGEIMLPKRTGWWNHIQLCLTAIHKVKPRDRFVPHKPMQFLGNVLVLDKNPQVIREMQIHFASLGMTVHWESNASEGFRKIVALKPQLVISEFMLTAGLGNWILGRMRDCDIDTPMIFLTDVHENVSPFLAEEMLELGANAVFEKPLDWTKFNEVLREALPMLDMDRVKSKPVPQTFSLMNDGPQKAKPHIRLPAATTAQVEEEEQVEDFSDPNVRKGLKGPKGSWYRRAISQQNPSARKRIERKQSE